MQDDPTNQSAPSDTPTTGQQTRKTPINRSCDEPITGGHGKPSRAARRAANRAAKDAAVLTAWARTNKPAGLSLENQPAPSPAPMTGLHTAKERNTQGQDNRSDTVGVGQLTVGRPSEYTGAEADVICAWVQAGGSLRSYNRETGRPVATIYRWMRQNAVFLTLLTAAHEDRADTLAEETIEIADAIALTPTIEGVAAAKLQIEARKWVATKLRPSKWGDKQVVEHVGAVSIRIGIPAKPQATAPIEAGDDGVYDVSR